MSFLSKLSQLKKGQTPYRVESDCITKRTGEDTSESLLPKRYIRDEDPAVKRLKEIRQKERLKNGVPESKKKVARRPRSNGGSDGTRKKANHDERDISTVYRKKIGGHVQSSSKAGVRHEPLKKMSFDELMKQADTNATPKSAKPEMRSMSKATMKITKPGFKARNRQHMVTPPIEKTRPNSLHREEQPVRISLPKNTFAQPNHRIKAKLQKKHGKPKDNYYDDERDSDLDDFIEEDEDDTQHYQSRDTDPGYDRDEIWAMFNRNGKRRAYEDYDEDDMETNEMDILAEEEEASRMARMEDKREQQWLRNHDELKKRQRNPR